MGCVPVPLAYLPEEAGAGWPMIGVLVIVPSVAGCATVTCKSHCRASCASALVVLQCPGERAAARICFAVVSHEAFSDCQLEFIKAM